MQNLNFGTFCTSTNSGTVVINPYGNRSKTGNIILLGSVFSAALYYVTAIPGTIIHVYNGSNAELTSGLGTMILEIGDSWPPTPFIATDEQTPVTIGGTLFVGSSQVTPAGYYTGEFQVTFIQE